MCECMYACTYACVSWNVSLSALWPLRSLQSVPPPTPEALGGASPLRYGVSVSLSVRVTLP